ncbi:hypothetical protein PALI_a3518 [Pseudoalteromonas aliena SW19]|uniref:Uncharacterized protein n=1 Tax=Pseudoalteromonas aliena SW19 TaxID=1314866 RepID=A0ABR9DWL1_9GAMM|nr:hypothetical protein [Pseudoalteromonas aliena SW19]
MSDLFIAVFTNVGVILVLILKVPKVFISLIWSLTLLGFFIFYFI